MIALIIIIAVIVLLLLLPVGIDATYEDGLELKIKIGPVAIHTGDKKSDEVQPKQQKDGEDPEENNRRKPERKKKSVAFGMTGSQILQLIGILLKTLNRLRRGFRVKLFRLYLTIGGDDPADAAIMYGNVNSAISFLLPLAHQIFHVKDEDIQTIYDFTGGPTRGTGEIVLTIRLGALLIISLCTLFAMLRCLRGTRIKSKKSGKKSEAESQQPVVKAKE